MKKLLSFLLLFIIFINPSFAYANDAIMNSAEIHASLLSNGDIGITTTTTDINGNSSTSTKLIERGFYNNLSLNDFYYEFVNPNEDGISNGILTFNLENLPSLDTKFSYKITGDGNITDEYYKNTIIVDFKDLDGSLGIKLEFESIIKENSDEETTLNEDMIIEDGRNNFLNGNALLFIIPILLMIALILYLLIKNRNKLHNVFSHEGANGDQKAMINMPINLPPALIYSLINDNKVSKDIFPISILYLAISGYYEIDKSKPLSANATSLYSCDYILKPLNKKSLPKEKHLSFLIKWLSAFEKDNRISLSRVVDLLKTDRNLKHFTSNYEIWEKLIIKDSEIFYSKSKNLTKKYRKEYNKWIALKDSLNNNNSDNINFGKKFIIYSYALDIDPDTLSSLLNSHRIDTTLSNYYKNHMDFILYCHRLTK